MRRLLFLALVGLLAVSIRADDDETSYEEDKNEPLKPRQVRQLPSSTHRLHGGAPTAFSHSFSSSPLSFQPPHSPSAFFNPHSSFGTYGPHSTPVTLRPVHPFVHAEAVKKHNPFTIQKAVVKPIHITKHPRHPTSHVPLIVTEVHPSAVYTSHFAPVHEPSPAPQIYHKGTPSPQSHSFLSPASIGTTYSTPAPHDYNPYNTPTPLPYSPHPPKSYSYKPVHETSKYSPYSPSPKPVAKSCPHYDQCHPIATCAPLFQDLLSSHYAECPLTRGAYGVCCPPRPEAGYSTPLFTAPNPHIPIRDFTLDQLNDAARAGLWELVERDILEKSLQERNIVVSDRRSAAYGHLQFFRTSPRATKLGRDALTTSNSADQLVRAYKLSPMEASYGLQRFSFKETIIGNTCPANPDCGEKEKYYRSYDGSCNNEQNESWGSARTPFQRILPPQYADGVHASKVAKDGSELPSARIVSISVVVDVDRPYPDITLGVMQWGQFIDHDLTHAPIFRFGNESGIECCSEDGDFVDPSFLHPSCLAIRIPDDDPFFAKFGRRCMNFVRSMPAPRNGCNFGFTEQMNQITHWLDNSGVYGSMEEEAENVRLHRGGRLRVSERELLPADPSLSEEGCDMTNQGRQCFLAGDNRVNEQPGLVVFHTIWMREHNRVAGELEKRNPHWNDETIYQEARRIVIAEYQHIIYNEWLPIILGPDYVHRNDMTPLREGFQRTYDSGINPNIFNEFASAAFRFGHTLVQGMIDLFDKSGRKSETLTLHDHFNIPTLIYTPGKLDEFMRALAMHRSQQFDNFVTEELTNHLFQRPDMQFGMDLVALNLQRGRDHAIASYNELREACGVPRARTFDDLVDLIPAEVVATFKLLYRSVDDIDLFVAGISEHPVEGALIGPTFQCIIGDQFNRLKMADRFFYENGGLKTSFTEAQLYEIRRTSWARILCDNGDHIQHMQPLALRTPGLLNSKVSCESPSIPRVNLDPWISEPGK